MLSLTKKWGKPREIVTSNLLSRPFDAHKDRDCIHLLDVGVGVADTVEFLKQYLCKVYFLDLADELAGDDPQAISKTLDSYTGELFDVCLFWDLLHQLSGPQLELLSNALEPYIYSGTQVHSIVNLMRPTERYRIRGPDQFEVINGKAREYHPWSFTQFAKHFHCFQITRDELREDGQLEMLLEVPV